MTLQKEIDNARGEIRTDGYPVSIGEWISIYERRELDIHPEFQRFFRWTVRQKSRLIESILLGIPIPQVFVAQRADGVWDVVDGLQRLSTIFQFVGVLRDENGNPVPQLALEATTYLPSLAEKKWDDEANPSESLTQAQRLLIKRAKIDVSIILKESGESTKYELFQRLNTGGSQLSDQELRSSIIVMLNKEFYWWMKSLAEDQNFQDCVALTEKALEEQYDLELVLRFLVFRTMPARDLVNLGDIGEFLTDKARALAMDRSFDRQGEQEAFRRTFELLRASLANDSFRRYEIQRKRFSGGFLLSAYEAVALGLGHAHRSVSISPEDLSERIKNIWSDPDFTGSSGSGVRASSRVPKIIPFGRRLFGK